MRTLVSFCNFSPARSHGLLAFDIAGSSHEWIDVHGGNATLVSVTGVWCAAQRVYAAWIDSEHRSFVSVLERPSLGLVSVQPLSDVRDAHSVCVHEGALLVVSTGTDQVWRYALQGDAIGSGEPVWSATGERRDTHHLNSIAPVGDALWCSGFGPKAGDLWSSALEGYVVDVGTGDTVASRLQHPHSLLAANGEVFVAESRRARVRCLTADRAFDVGGYARGLCFLPDGTCATGLSAARVQSRSTGVVENPADPGEAFGGAGVFLRAPGGQPAPDRHIDLSRFGSEIYDVVSLAV